MPSVPHAARTVLLAALIAFVAGIGITHILNPDYFIRRSGVRKGGEMLTDWNRTGFRVVGAAAQAFAIYIAYEAFQNTSPSTALTPKTFA